MLDTERDKLLLAMARQQLAAGIVAADGPDINPVDYTRAFLDFRNRNNELAAALAETRED